MGAVHSAHWCGMAVAVKTVTDPSKQAHIYKKAPAQYMHMHMCMHMHMRMCMHMVRTVTDPSKQEGYS